MQRLLFQVYYISMKKLKHIQMPNTVRDMLVKSQNQANTAFFKKKYASPPNQLARNCDWFMIIADFTPFNYRSCQGVKSYSQNCSRLPDFQARGLGLRLPSTGIGLGNTAIICWFQGWGKCPAPPSKPPTHSSWSDMRKQTQGFHFKLFLNSWSHLFMLSSTK